MGSLIIPLDQAGARSARLIGGKARVLGRLLDAGYRVPPGFCIQVAAYEQFVSASNLEATIGLELGRKPFAEMRWEEIWDAALRIRSAFLAAPMPDAVADSILQAYDRLDPQLAAVRSSAPEEDSGDRSFAGLHESLIGIQDAEALLDAVRIVWASLWSDAALLYRQELGLDETRSRMAVVVQKFVPAPVSGVGFGLDPLNPDQDRQIIEAVPGFCEDLVSGAVDPDRWLLKKSSGELVSWTPGQRGVSSPQPVLAAQDLEKLHQTLSGVEAYLGYPPDVEWTGRSETLTLLQARPVTGPGQEDEERGWYLSLRPGTAALRELCERVTEHLIPALREEGERLASEDLTGLTDGELAEAITIRQEAHERWKIVYKDEFIPFAHGVRQCGKYYNDAVRPDDPYEFVGLLEHLPMLASQRNAALQELAGLLRQDRELADRLTRLAADQAVTSRGAWQKQTAKLLANPAGESFLRGFEAFLDQHVDLVFKGESLDDRPDLVLDILLQLVSGPERKPAKVQESRALEAKLFAAVGPEREEEARDVLRVARLSWQLRDDDNILMGRLENQLHHALTVAVERLQAQGRLATGSKPRRSSAPVLVQALQDPQRGPVELPQDQIPAPAASHRSSATTPRQLIGQPAARGLARGRVCVVRGPEDFRNFQQGDVMVCDAIQPTMTHLVTLASAIVERRGGMLIHGAIIARELGIPCVNGVPDATGLLENGDEVTVDGHLGIVTLGPAEFDLELG